MMREQNYGRILMTASSTGLYGNFGQANYGAAKLGLAGLTKTLAARRREIQRQGQHHRPGRGDAHDRGHLPARVLELFGPSNVVPAALYSWSARKRRPTRSSAPARAWSRPPM